MQDMNAEKIIKAAIYFFAHRIENGGGITQARHTYEALKAAGHSVVFVLKEGTISTDDIDMTAQVHHFVGANPAFIPLMRKIKEQHLGVIALSTIYWWTPAVQRVVTPDLLNFLRYTLARYVKRALKHRLARFEVYSLADLLLPNSPGEATLVKHYFPVSPNALICPVPNATDPIPQTRPTLVQSLSLPEKFILCAGSFNTRKNQLSLIKALKGTDLPVVFVGAPGLVGENGNYDDYYVACQAAATPNMRFLGHIEHRSQEWHEIFSRATVFAMASACETPSLAALEAALYGSSLAITAIGSAFEYFGPHANYCDPNNLASVRRTVEAAWQRDRSQALCVHVAENFLWSNAAKITALAYRSAVTLNSKALEDYLASVTDLWYDYHLAAPSSPSNL